MKKKIRHAGLCLKKKKHISDNTLPVVFGFWLSHMVKKLICQLLSLKIPHSPIFSTENTQETVPYGLNKPIYGLKLALNRLKNKKSPEPKSFFNTWFTFFSNIKGKKAK
jgi:hypothetical protein